MQKQKPDKINNLRGNNTYVQNQSKKKNQNIKQNENNRICSLVVLNEKNISKQILTSSPSVHCVYWSFFFLDLDTYMSYIILSE